MIVNYPDSRYNGAIINSSNANWDGRAHVNEHADYWADIVRSAVVSSESGRAISEQVCILSYIAIDSED